MGQNLYHELKAISEADNLLKNCQYKVNLDLSRHKDLVIQDYMYNPVLDDAISGRKSLEESLDELSSTRSQMRRFLPWRKDERHNSKLSYLGMLVDSPEHLRTHGVLSSDNVVTAICYSSLAAIAMTSIYAVISEAIPGASALTPEPGYFGVALGSTASPIMAFGFTKKRLGELPVKQVRYVDDVIRELYH